MTLADQLPALTLGVLLLAAPLAFLANARGARVVSVCAAVAEVLLAAVLAFQVRSAGVLEYRVGGWGAPLGIDFRIDGISAVLIALAAVVGLAVTVYAAAYFGPDEKYRHYWPLWLFLWGSLVALFSTNDAFNLYVCLELVSISAVSLVSVGGSKTALVAAMRYMLAAVTGSLFYLFGVAMIYGAAGTLDIGMLARTSASSPAAQVGLALVVSGLVVKTALVPMHFWLPPAHANAPSPVSAVLSALVVKGSFYIIMRLMIAMDGGELLPGLPFVLGVMGATAIVWGSVQAFVQVRLKMLVAYSTVAQIGYLFILFPLVWSSTTAEQAGMAVSAGVFHAVSHALAKGAMFLVAGAVLHEMGHDRLADLGGYARTAPLQVLAFGLAGVSMLGLPPSGGFVSKWLYVSTALDTGAWYWAIPVLGGGILAAVYIFKVIAVFLGAPASGGGADASDERAVTSAWLSWSPMALAIASFLVGIAGQPILNLVTPAAEAMVRGVVG